MNALLDQNRSFRLVELLVPRFPVSCHVRDVGLAGEDHERILAFAKAEGFVIITKDNDVLAQARVRGHPQVVQVCLGNALTRQVASLLRARLDDIERFVTENTESVFLLRERRWLNT